MTKTESINKAIQACKGKKVTKRDIVAHESDPICYEFLKYKGDNAIVKAQDGSQKSFPKAEIFDVNLIKTAAMHFLNVGYWKEGMESTIVSL